MVSGVHAGALIIMEKKYLVKLQSTELPNTSNLMVQEKLSLLEARLEKYTNPKTREIGLKSVRLLLPPERLMTFYRLDQNSISATELMLSLVITVQL